MARTAFVGLGVMGFPMAGHLVRAGHQVTASSRRVERAGEWRRAHGAATAPTPAEACQDAEVAILCVGNDDHIRSVVLGADGMLSALEPEAVIVDHSTASAEVARELAQAAAGRGVGFIDAPVSGGQAGAEQGTLTVMCGGDPDAYARIAPVIAAYSRSQRLIGPTGSGQLAKMVNQICIAGLVQGLAEGLSFGQRAGLDMAAVIEVISKGAAQSWQMENRAATMCESRFDFGFAVDWMRKDLGICLEEARRTGARLPVTALVDQFYAQVQAMGGGRWDTSSLMAALRD